MNDRHGPAAGLAALPSGDRMPGMIGSDLTEAGAQVRGRAD